MTLKEELHELFKRAVLGRMDAVERLVELIHPSVQHHADQVAAADAGKAFDSAAAIVQQQVIAPYLIGGAPVDPATHSLPQPAGEIEPGTVTSATPAAAVAEAPAVDLLDTSAPAVAADPAPVVVEPTDVKA